jgi:hypothetical protein
MDNLETWERFADIDPKFTKQITGKQYKGTSPNPQYVIRCLTELFGPVGQGFGWRVIAEDFTQLGGETLHWCRIEFWHTDRVNVVESYGQTKAAYITNGGKQMVDEDAPKKSLTDAIIKAASWVGIGSNIFLGRWDDQKYVAQVDAGYRAEDRAKDAPEVTEEDIKELIAFLADAESVDELRAKFAKAPPHVRADERAIKAGKGMAEALNSKPADPAAQDEIPYEGK